MAAEMGQGEYKRSAVCPSAFRKTSSTSPGNWTVICTSRRRLDNELSSLIPIFILHIPLLPAFPLLGRVVQLSLSGLRAHGLDAGIQQLAQAHADTRLLRGVVPGRGRDVAMPQEPAGGVNSVLCYNERTHFLSHFMQ